MSKFVLSNITCSKKYGKVGETILLTATDNVFSKKVVVRDSGPNGKLFSSIKSNGYSVSMKVPKGFVGPDIYIDDEGENYTIQEAFTVRPVITKHPNSMVVLEGSSACFIVSAFSNSSIKYQWYRNNKKIVGENGYVYRIDTKLINDCDTIHCKLSDATGIAKTNDSILTVLMAPPKIVVHPRSQSKPDKSLCLLSVVADGSGDIKYQWYRDGKSLTGKTGSQYEFVCILNNNGTNIYCTVSNEAGEIISDTATINVIKNAIKNRSSSFGFRATGI